MLVSLASFALCWGKADLEFEAFKVGGIQTSWTPLVWHKNGVLDNWFYLALLVVEVRNNDNVWTVLSLALLISTKRQPLDLNLGLLLLYLLMFFSLLKFLVFSRMTPIKWLGKSLKGLLVSINLLAVSTFRNLITYYSIGSSNAWPITKFSIL